MTKQFIILIIFLTICLVVMLLDLPYSNWILVCNTLLYYSYSIWLFFQMAKQNITGDFVLRKETKKNQPLLLLLALLATVAYFINHRIELFTIYLFWSVALVDLLTVMITRKFKPIGIAILGNILMLNNFGKTQRNLSQLESIRLNGLTNELVLKFKSENRLYIKRSEYKEEDIEQLIAICKAKSDEQLLISENLNEPLSKI